MTKIQLITPTREIISDFNSFWTSKPNTTTIKLFANDDAIDINRFIAKGRFKEYGDQDDEICKTQDLMEFLKKINSLYHTRVSKIDVIIEKLRILGITDKNSFEEKIKNVEMTLPKFVGCCKEATGKYTYSFASKVFSFIDEEKYPIIDSFVATMLEKYEYKGKIDKSKWGDYSQYIENYNAFKNHYEITDLSFKKIDKFLWTYAKILSDYWTDFGVLKYKPVFFDTKTKI